IEVSCSIWRGQNAHAVKNLVRHLPVLCGVARERARRIYAFNSIAAMDVCCGHSVHNHQHATPSDVPLSRLVTVGHAPTAGTAIVGMCILPVKFEETPVFIHIILNPAVGVE